MCACVAVRLREEMQSVSCYKCFSNPCQCADDARRAGVAKRWARLCEWGQVVWDMTEELDGLQNLKVALRTAQPSASVRALRRVMPILQAARGVTPSILESENNAFEDAVFELDAEIADAASCRRSA